ncbi:MAG: PAS domain S-box protein [Peptococcaceae bacterium]|nr:PAS domain S-box protein [Peptococcaceae bacterium]
MANREMAEDILSNISELVYVRDLQKNILYMNKRAEQITGWQAGEVVPTKKCFEVFGDNRGRCKDNCPVDFFFEKKGLAASNFERPIKTREGQKAFFKISISPLIRKGELTGGIVVMQDITRLKEYEDMHEKNIEKLEAEIAKRMLLEKSLVESEKKYRATFEHTGTAMIVINKDGIISMANQEVEKISGYSPEEIAGKMTWDKLVHPDDLEKVKKYLIRRSQPDSGVPDRYEFRLLHKSGKTREIIFSINPIPDTDQYVGSLIDITGRKQMERALLESEEKYRLLLETIEDGFYEVDLDGNLLYYNNAMARIYGTSDTETLVGMNYHSYVDKENAGILFKAFNKVFNSGTPEKGVVGEIIRKDGKRRTLEISISLVRDGSGKRTGFRGIVRDITERRQAEERLKFLSMHDMVTGLYNRTYFEEEITRLNNSRFSPITIICCDVDGLKLINDTLGHKKGDELLKAVAGVLKEPLRTSDVVARTGGDEFAIILPKTDQNAARNICARINKAIESYNQKRADLPVSLSIGMATGIIPKELSCSELYRLADNDMYRQKLQSKINSRGAIVSSLTKALEDRDFLADGHAQRIFDYANRLGELVGLSEREMTDLKLLAQFHDIGKVGISDSILFKPASLTKKEWEEMKKHSEIGFRVARSTPELISIADWILYHHEWWNGKGYPLGLKGDEIPLLCRVFAIADAYDAMTSPRPYRKPISSGKALKELARMSGTQFDPRLVEQFFTLMRYSG